MRLRTAGAADLDVVTLYAILRLRVDVFVVEQRCPYPELDGRDLEASALHCWLEDENGIVACLRLLDDGPARRIGRVATLPAARGRGHAQALVRHAVALAVPAPVVVHAQSHLAGWYERLGFTVDGPAFVEDAIAHVPMRRCLRQDRAAATVAPPLDDHG